MPQVGDPRMHDRFWAKVEVNNTGCWIWNAYRDRDGYGKYRYDGRSDSPQRLTHRLTWTMLVGPIPADMQIDHLCRDTSCCNPEHLEVVTRRENVDRSGNYIALNRKKTHCPEGHPYAGDNLILKQHKGVTTRVCRTCRNYISKMAMRARREALVV